MSFDSAFIKTVGLEGGYQCNPNDKGNWTGGQIGVGELKGTKYGISAASYPNEDIKNLTQLRAKEIYFQDFWMPLNLDQVKNQYIQEEIFDTAVNTSSPKHPITAGKIVQRAINFLEIGKPLEEDGIIGPYTVAYVNKWCHKDPVALFKCLNGYQFIYYEAIATSGVLEQFAWGWMKRIQEYRSEA
jgi:lysozyme family protein